jgi:hypothetical protein
VPTERVTAGLARKYGEVKLHFCTFGGLKATSEWIAGSGKEG